MKKTYGFRYKWRDKTRNLVLGVEEEDLKVKVV